MYEKGGLSYHVLGRKGKRMGVPIKSSSIYTKPTLKYLESVFLTNKSKKQFHKIRLQRSIDNVLQSPVKDRFAFRLALKRENIDVLYRENESMVYGITFIDHNTKCVFNGSDLGKAYTAKSLLERITESGAIEIQRQEKEREKLQNCVNSFDYHLSAEQNLSWLYGQGIQLETAKNKYGYDKYYLSFQEGDSSVKAGGLSRFDRYFSENGITENLCRDLQDYIVQNDMEQIRQYIHHLFAERSETYFGHTTADKKKQQRKVNW